MQSSLLVGFKYQHSTKLAVMWLLQLCKGQELTLLANEVCLKMLMVSFSHPNYSLALPGSITVVLLIWTVLLMQQSADEQGICAYSTEHIYQVLVAKPYSVMSSIQIPAHLALKEGKRNCTGQKKRSARPTVVGYTSNVCTLYHFSDCSIVLQFLFSVSLQKNKKFVLSLSLADRNRYKERLQRVQKLQIS